MSNITTIDPTAPRVNMSKAADELARLTELRDAADEAIGKLKARILTDLGPLAAEHTSLKGKSSLWDIRCLPNTTIAYKQIAAAMQAPPEIIRQFTTQRMQISFKRLPQEIK